MNEFPMSDHMNNAYSIITMSVNTLARAIIGNYLYIFLYFY